MSRLGLRYSLHRDEAEGQVGAATHVFGKSTFVAELTNRNEKTGAVISALSAAVRADLARSST